MAGVPKPEEGAIPGIEGLAGRARKEAMYKQVRRAGICFELRVQPASSPVHSLSFPSLQAYGEELYNRDATAFFEEGTKENPIPILSVEDSRIVGVSLPDDPEIRWFTLHKGHLAYDPDTANYFALKKVGTRTCARGWRGGDRKWCCSITN